MPESYLEALQEAVNGVALMGVSGTIIRVAKDTRIDSHRYQRYTLLFLDFLLG